MGLNPQVVQTPRTGVSDALSNLFTQALSDPSKLTDLFKNLSLPSYTGSLTAPPTGLQTAAGGAGPGALTEGLSVADALNSGLKTFTSGDSGANILKMLDQARQSSLTTTKNDIRESYGLSGLEESTPAAKAIGDASTQSEQSFLGTAANLLPTLTGQQLQAMGMMPGAAELPLALTSGAYGLGTQEQATAQNPLTAAYNEFTRTQGGLFSPLLNFGAGAPTITGPGKGSQLLSGLAGVGAAYAGAKG